MKKDKLVYEAPEAEIFEVRFAENMLNQTSDPSLVWHHGGAGSYENDTNNNGYYD